MSENQGYVTDIVYTAGFYGELAPVRLAFAALAQGRDPGVAHPQRVLELGFGQGFGLALLAASNPDVAFEGCDFNPAHVAHAQGLIDGAGLENIEVRAEDFAETAARGGGDADIIVLHGVFSWVGPEAQRAVLDTIERRLSSRGLVYISYNALPGWAPIAPIRELILELKRRAPAASREQMTLALHLLQGLRQHSAYLAANPAAARHLDEMLAQDPVYLAHEYLAEHARPLAFGEVAGRLSALGLDFLASATLIENLEVFAWPSGAAPEIAQACDPVLRETLRDMASNKWFRRDIFGRNATPRPPEQARAALDLQRFALTVPRNRLDLNFRGPFGVLKGMPELYGPIAERLAQEPMSFAELLALPAFGPEKSATLLECLVLLAHSGQVEPLPSRPADPKPARRFNRLLAERALEGRFYPALASPALRTGLPVDDFGLLAVAAALEGEAEDAERAAGFALKAFAGLGRGMVEEGRPIADPATATSAAVRRMQPLVEHWLPLWRQLDAL